MAFWGGLQRLSTKYPTLASDSLWGFVVDLSDSVRICTTTPGNPGQRLLLDRATLCSDYARRGYWLCDSGCSDSRWIERLWPATLQRLLSDFRKIFPEKPATMARTRAEIFDQGVWVAGRGGRRQPLGRGLIRSRAACHAAMQ